MDDLTRVIVIEGCVVENAFIITIAGAVGGVKLGGFREGIFLGALTTDPFFIAPEGLVSASARQLNCEIGNRPGEGRLCERAMRSL